MASVSRYGGKWRAQVYVKGVRSSKSFRTRHEAIRWAAGQEDSLRAGPERKTFADLITQYISDVTPKKSGSRHEALRLQAMLSNYPGIAEKRLSDLRASDFAQWRDSRLKEVKGESIRRTVSTLSHAFKLARTEWGWMTNNPLDGFRSPQSSPPRDRLITRQEIRGMLNALGTEKQREVALAFLVALRTGMRAGEILQITPENVDLDKRVVKIRQHKTLKLTGKPRLIPITPKAARVIARIDRFTIQPSSLDTMFRKARERAGLSGFTFHDSRATALTWLARKVDVLTLARISGHSDIALLGRVYYRESAEDIAKRL